MQYGLCCCIVWPSFTLFDCFVKIGATCKSFLGKWFTVPPTRRPCQKIARTPMHPAQQQRTENSFNLTWLSERFRSLKHYCHFSVCLIYKLYFVRKRRCPVLYVCSEMTEVLTYENKHGVASMIFLSNAAKYRRCMYKRVKGRDDGHTAFMNFLRVI